MSVRGFPNRREAGRQLADLLVGPDYRDAVVLAIPRGGVPVGFEVAAALHLPLDLVMVRKLGAPFEPELAIGAVGEGDVQVLNSEVIELSGIAEHEVAAVERRVRRAMAAHERRLRAGCAPIPVVRKRALIVDDGIATGACAQAACESARFRGAREVLVAVPVAAASAIAALGEVAQEVIAIEAPTSFLGVGDWYRDFTQTSDEEVARLLCTARAAFGDNSPSETPSGDNSPSPAQA